MINDNTHHINQASRYRHLCCLVIEHLTQKIQVRGYRPVLHFELEGVFEYSSGRKPLTNFDVINNELERKGIDGVIVDEYWANQWEYVSLFNGQSPLKEAKNLANVFHILPKLVKPLGVERVLFNPVVWSGDRGRYVAGSAAIFANDNRPVHIPNAIQINISLEDTEGRNVVATSTVGEWIQYQLLCTGRTNCVLFLPEQDAFERIKLRTQYGLSAELCSPYSLTSGHQGSIALYKQIGKHNQPLGIEPQVLGADNQILSYTVNWHKTARVEHRLGATSNFYDPFVNVIYILMNVLEALTEYEKDTTQLPPPFNEVCLPEHLVSGAWRDGYADNAKDADDGLDAVTLFRADDWFETVLNVLCMDSKEHALIGAGTRIKRQVMSRFESAIETNNKNDKGVS